MDLVFLTRNIKVLKVFAAQYTWANNLFEEYSKKSPTAPSSGKNLVASDLRCHASRPTLSTTFFFDRTGGGGGYREYEKSVHCSALFALAIYQVVLWKREKEGVVIVVIVAEIKSLSHWLTHSVTRSPIELSWTAKKHSGGFLQPSQSLHTCPSVKCTNTTMQVYYNHLKTSNFRGPLKVQINWRATQLKFGAHKSPKLLLVWIF